MMLLYKPSAGYEEYQNARRLFYPASRAYYPLKTHCGYRCGLRLHFGEVPTTPRGTVCSLEVMDGSRHIRQGCVKRWSWPRKVLATLDVAVIVLTWRAQI